MPSSRITKASLALVAALAVPAMLATPALASAARPAASTGQFKTWPQAQHAAGYALKRPGTTFGLKMVGRILVDKCVTNTKRRVVSVNYGSFIHRGLGLVQDNAAGSCDMTSAGTSLGTYKIHGMTAHMYGYCNLSGAPPCSSVNIELWLVWKSKSFYYTASSHDFSRHKLWLFADHLVKV
jgi:hypothetical protein